MIPPVSDGRCMELKKKPRFLNLTGLLCYMRACKNGLVGILVLFGCVFEVSLTTLGMICITLLVVRRQPCGLKR